MKKVILFDFDGVIVDSFETAYGMTQEFKMNITREQYRNRFMGNVYDAVKNENPNVDIKDRLEKWFGMYGPRLLELPIVPGMAKVIKQLSKKYNLVIISSSINSPIHAYLEKHDIHHYFDEVYGADVHLDKKEKIKMVLKKYGVTAKDCLFLTDTVGDLLEAQHQKIESLVVTWGFHPKQRFTGQQLIDCVDQPEEIVPKIEKYFSNN